MTLYVSPYRRMARMREAMDRIMDEGLAEQEPAEREMLLAVDVQAADDDFIINALVPGLDADDLEIEVLNNTVAIRGEFKGLAGENAKFLTCELPEGRFARIITLPVEVDASKAEASIKNGLLNLSVPKAEAHRPKAIKVNAA